MHTHPIHPIFVHFPIVFWSTASLCDLLGIYNDEFWFFGNWCLFLGCISALPTTLSGFWDFTTKEIPRRAHLTFKWHASSATLAFSLYITTLLIRYQEGRLITPSITAISLSVLALIALSIAGFLGGSLVYRFSTGTCKQEQEFAGRSFQG